MSRLELCFNCTQPTGRAGASDDSIFIFDQGPYCEECRDGLYAEVESYTEKTHTDSDLIDAKRAAAAEAVEQYEKELDAFEKFGGLELWARHGIRSGLAHMRLLRNDQKISSGIPPRNTKEQ